MLAKRTIFSVFAAPVRSAGGATHSGDCRAVELGPNHRCDLGTEELHGAQDVAVGDGADAHLRDVALVAEKPVSRENLLGHLFG
jgi:hypothetical protein